MSVHLVKGAEPTLRDAVLDDLLRELVGDDDRSLAVEDLSVPRDADGGAEARATVVDAAMNAAQSPPFMTSSRVVVLREAGNLTTGDAAPLVAYLADPLDTTALVVVAGGGKLPDALAKALKAAGATELGPPTEDTARVLGHEAAAAGLRLGSEATAAVVARLGQDAGRVPALVETLAGALGADRVLGADDVAPYLGESSAVPVYELANAIDAGDAPAALEVLHRLLRATGARQARPMHPLQVLAVLHNHYVRLLRLDDPTITSPAAAVEALDGKVKEYPARKALEQARALGTDGLRRAFDLLAQADLDCKGARAIPDELVLDVLVARLAALAKRARGARRRPAGARR